MPPDAVGRVGWPAAVESVALDGPTHAQQTGRILL